MLKQLQSLVVALPDKIISCELKSHSKTTILLYLNNSWQFSFRIHNASTKVETSLKFDIKLINMPNSIITINAKWVDK
ncbi:MULTISPECIES: HaeIII family restriction endonuclease [unclassified Campylobacter]|uniref:HaeIII family restriction endonuclease n=1 Tax=unclassified Campylobacter TaxID=2593542 RepID=UPI0021DF9865|nr:MULTISPECIES: HaeIII family restriction endonuclease [unclassified Campylobacter]